MRAGVYELAKCPFCCNVACRLLFVLSRARAWCHSPRAALQRLVSWCRFRWRWITLAPHEEQSTLGCAEAGQLSRLCVWRRIHSLKCCPHPKHFSREPPQHSKRSSPRPGRGASGRGGSGSSASSLVQPFSTARSVSARRSSSRRSWGQNSPHSGGMRACSRASSASSPGKRPRS